MAMAVTILRFLNAPKYTPIFFLNSINYKGQGRHVQFLEGKASQWRPHQRRVAAAAAALFSAKSRQGLGGLASRGGPEPR